MSSLFVRDDDDVDMEEATPRPLIGPRPYDSEGEPFETVCFDHNHLHHPYKHKLICGHTIITRNVESCGGNCEPNKNATSKPSTRKFECPDPSCVRLRAVTVAPKNKKTGRAQVGRMCELSHIYGLDPKADTARIEEKKDLRERGRRSVHPTMRALLRKSSVSPVRTKRSKTVIGDVGHQPDTPMHGIEVEIDADERKLKDDVVARQSGRKTKLEAAVVPLEDHSYTGFRCDGDGCGQLLSGVRYHCTDPACRDDDPRKKGPGVDLCIECFQRRLVSTFKHRPARRRDHIFEKRTAAVIEVLNDDPLVDASDDNEDQNEANLEAKVMQSEDEDDIEVHCVCKSTSNELMMECEKCEKHFHPGCIGYGFHADMQYESDEPYKFFKADIEKIKAVGGFETPYLCFGCQHRSKELPIVNPLKAVGDRNKPVAKKREFSEFELDAAPKVREYQRKIAVPRNTIATGDRKRIKDTDGKPANVPREFSGYTQGPMVLSFFGGQR